MDLEKTYVKITHLTKNQWWNYLCKVSGSSEEGIWFDKNLGRKVGEGTKSNSVKING